MNNTERLKAINQLARETGRPRAALLATMAPSWGLAPAELAELKLEILSTPAPLSQAAEATVTTATTLAAAREAKALEAQIEADVRAVGAFREWSEIRKNNPHAAQLMVNTRGDEIYRGKALAETENTTTEPPSAA